MASKWGAEFSGMNFVRTVVLDASCPIAEVANEVGNAKCRIDPAASGAFGERLADVNRLLGGGHCLKCLRAVGCRDGEECSMQMGA
jgi:hypothetical protein